MGEVYCCDAYLKGIKIGDYMKSAGADTFSLEVNLGYCVAINCETEKCRKRQLEGEIERLLAQLWAKQVQK